MCVWTDEQTPAAAGGTPFRKGARAGRERKNAKQHINIEKTRRFRRVFYLEDCFSGTGLPYFFSKSSIASSYSLDLFIRVSSAKRLKAANKLLSMLVLIRVRFTNLYSKSFEFTMHTPVSPININS
jgi:hypothetical protein